ncbi:MAG: RluA family pseudouridine synthase [Firmicutes bacterium HGW-Firmicutes-1]|jgi:23S rRNA pseudouridine955/2504/2580 synthase|nr:MAG: RluA family pseudouridine synthase [Firmicutes bacterium HGW-Firmicutes-1]
MKSYIISSIEENQRVDKYIMKVLGKASKSFIYKMFRKKNIKLNDKKIEGHEILMEGDEIKIFFSDDTFETFKKEEDRKVATSITFTILFEDENLLVCNKPVGLLSQPDGKGENLVDQIESYLNMKESSFKPGICNRLDRNTSGIIIAGKNIKALQLINGAIASRAVEKLYLTIVKGVITDENTIEGYLLKDEATNKVTIHLQPKGDFIKTIYKPIKNNGDYTLLQVKIITGKSHQIRAHLQSIGHPIVGDHKYGDSKVNRYFDKHFHLNNQLLHAYKFEILEIEGQLHYLNNKQFEAPLTAQFDTIVTELF